jgi:hypothetical protein
VGASIHPWRCPALKFNFSSFLAQMALEALPAVVGEPSETHPKPIGLHRKILDLGTSEDERVSRNSPEKIPPLPREPHGQGFRGDTQVLLHHRGMVFSAVHIL